MAKKAFTAANANHESIKLVPVNKDGTVKNLHDQTGWQKKGDTVVQERTRTEIAKGLYVFDVKVYDFANYTVEAWKIDDAKDALPTFAGSLSFDQLQGVRGVEIAHKALTQLGGKPGPLHVALGLDAAGNPVEDLRALRKKQVEEKFAATVPDEGQRKSVGFKASWMKNG